MRSLMPFLALGLALGGCRKPAPKPPAMETCTPRSQFTKTGFFHVEEDCGRPLLIDSTGKPFFSFGVNHVDWYGDSDKMGNNPYNTAVKARYGTPSAWAQATASRMQMWGWNTAGAWSGDAIDALVPYTPILTLSGADWQTGTIPDYFDPSWEAHVNAGAASGTAGRVNDPLLIGYFIDNEMHWGPDWRTNHDLLDDYMGLAATAPGKQALVNLFSMRHNADITSFNAAWNTTYSSFNDLAMATSLPPRGASATADSDRSAFISLVAQRFFKVTTDAIRAGDANHLILGVRFVAAYVPMEVAAAAGQYCDIVSVNDYEFIIDPQQVYPPDQYNMVVLPADRSVDNFYKATGRPILVSEFGWRAADSGLPNTWPPIYPTLATQSDRADHFQQFAQTSISSPWVVGYHWFEWADEPAEGRFDGENDNWGLVNSSDDPYPVVTQRTAMVNQTWTYPPK